MSDGYSGEGRLSSLLPLSAATLRSSRQMGSGDHKVDGGMMLSSLLHSAGPCSGDVHTGSDSLLGDHESSPPLPYPLFLVVVVFDVDHVEDAPYGVGWSKRC